MHFAYISYEKEINAIWEYYKTEEFCQRPPFSIKRRIKKPALYNGKLNSLALYHPCISQTISDNFAIAWCGLNIKLEILLFNTKFYKTFKSGEILRYFSGYMKVKNNFKGKVKCQENI